MAARGKLAVSFLCGLLLKEVLVACHRVADMANCYQQRSYLLSAGTSAGIDLCCHMHRYFALLCLVFHKKAPSVSRGLLGSPPTRQVSGWS